MTLQNMLGGQEQFGMCRPCQRPHRDHLPANDIPMVDVPPLGEGRLQNKVQRMVETIEKRLITFSEKPKEVMAKFQNLARQQLTNDNCVDDMEVKPRLPSISCFHYLPSKIAKGEQTYVNATDKKESPRKTNVWSKLGEDANQKERTNWKGRKLEDLSRKISADVFHPVNSWQTKKIISQSSQEANQWPKNLGRPWEKHLKDARKYSRPWTRSRKVAIKFRPTVKSRKLEGPKLSIPPRPLGRKTFAEIWVYNTYKLC